MSVAGFDPSAGAKSAMYQLASQLSSHANGKRIGTPRVTRPARGKPKALPSLRLPKPPGVR